MARGGKRQGAGRPVKRRSHSLLKCKAFLRRVKDVARLQLAALPQNVPLTRLTALRRQRSAILDVEASAALKVAVAWSSIAGAGWGLYARCSECVHRLCRRSRPPPKEQPLEITLQTQLCSKYSSHDAIVFSKGSLVGFYTGQQMPSAAVGDYVQSVGNLVLDAERWGSYMKYASCSECPAAANATFVKRLGDLHFHRDSRGFWRVPVVAQRDIYAHNEILLWYGDAFTRTKPMPSSVLL
jgi:hypothetical protein